MPNKLLTVALFGLVSVPSIYSKKEIRGKDTAPATLSTRSLVVNNDVDFWLTKGDQSVLLQKQTNVLAFGTTGDSHLASLATDIIFMPKVHPIVQPIVSTVPLHLFAYYVGTAKGLNVDRPRNLAKSVTVE